ncbi:MAG: hypothetical protein IH963_08500 [Chloroflexi bacterium]|nr:hypothetical protein [Chloroflexota bacterium]MCH8800935.1 hypothetical protein [Chloroflexota bacterium]MCH8894140.1 hypothetical protein [Chloroflexota bacterium]MCI0789734.1 hypothetical protein [Chloroflexota bacterium]MCI0830251.1 hypothetical protein [Chloroflexota bacterium]
MASPKQTFELELGTDQIAFIRSMKDKYDIVDEGKTLRAVIDYLIVTKNVHDDVFGKRRCFRCD